VNFSESESYLYSLGNEVLAMKLGLDNIRKLLAALGDPQSKYFKVQVAGTNGKGSVCVFLESICRSAGIKTGLTTSPHLVSITERVKIDGEQISDARFASLVTRIRTVSEDLVRNGTLHILPTYFEQVTAIALTAFAESNVELAILETGLGGRLDATTAARAEVAAITQIESDHQSILGNTLAEIAAEKAAIISTDTRTVIVADQLPEAISVILGRCSQVGISPKLASDVQVTNNECDISFLTRNDTYEIEKLGIPGRYQFENAKVAILLAESLMEDFPINRQNIIDGLQSARHPGRIEIAGNYIFDGAHNVAGARALREFLVENIAEPIIMIFGAMEDKDIAGIAAILFPLAEKLILTRPDNPRSASPQDLARSAAGHGDQIFVTDTVSDALAKAWELRSESEVILITGSLYLIGEAQKILNN
jgi:dihydrofolate synthase/folylpolyglutamate synthase